MTDMELLHRYVACGDRHAISRLISRYQKLVFNACLRRLKCPADAEDAMQQVFMAMIRGAGGIESSVRRWLYRCSANISVSMIRARANRAHREQEKGRQAGAWRPGGEVERKEAFDILTECLGELDAADKKVLLDNHVNGMTQRDIASSMGVTQQAVAKRIGRVMLHLRRELSSKGVIFSLVAAVVLAGKRAVSAAIPQGVKASLASAPSASAASVGAAGAGTVGALKISAAAVLLMTAVATYEGVEARRSRESGARAGSVSAAAVRESAARAGATVRSASIGRSPVGAAIPVEGGWPAQPVPRVHQASRLPALPGAEALNRPIAGERSGVARERLRPAAPLGPRSEPVRRVDRVSSWDVERPVGNRLATTAGMTGGDGGDPAALEAAAEELVELVLEDAPGGTAFSDAAVAGNKQRILGGPAISEDREVSKAGVRQWDLALTRNAAVAADAAAVNVSAWSVAKKEQIAAVKSGIADLEAAPSAAPPATLPIGGPRGSADSSEAITVPDGVLLAAAGELGGRLVNQGTVAAGEDGSPLRLTGLVSGRGSYAGDVVFAGEFSPGNSPAAVHLDAAILSQDNLLTMELAGLAPGSGYDQLLIGRHLTLGGDLDVQLIYGFSPGWGDRFTLFDGDFSGQFADMTLPALGDGLWWDTSDLYAGGSLQVVPEPGAAMVLVMAGLGLLARARRGAGVLLPDA